MSRAKLFQIAGPANHRLHPDHHPTYHHPPTPHSVRTNPHPSIVVTRDYLPSPAYSSHPNHPQQPSATMSRVISNNEQVWPLIHFFMFPFCKKIIDLLGGQTPHWGYTFLFHSSPSSWSQALEGLFELTQRTSKAINLASCVASRATETQGHH